MAQFAFAPFVLPHIITASGGQLLGVVPADPAHFGSHKAETAHEKHIGCYTGKNFTPQGFTALCSY